MGENVQKSAAQLSDNWLPGILLLIKACFAHNFCSETDLEGKTFSVNHKHEDRCDFPLRISGNSSYYKTLLN